MSLSLMIFLLALIIKLFLSSHILYIAAALFMNLYIYDFYFLFYLFKKLSDNYHYLNKFYLY